MAGHAAWEPAYSDGEFRAWLFAQKRNWRGRMKKRGRTIIGIAVLILIALLLARRIWVSNRLLRSFNARQEVVFNDGRVYAETDDYNMFKYRGRMIGKLSTGGGLYENPPLNVYAVKGEPVEKYIYVGAMGRGEFYKIIEE